MKKRVFAAMLAAMLCFVVVGCEKNEKTSADDDGKLTYWVAMPTQLVSSGMTFNEIPMYKEYNKRTGIDVEFIHPPLGQEGEKFNLMMASGNLADIIEYDWTKYSGGITKAVEDGTVVAMDDFIEKSAPNLFKILEENPNYRRVATTRSGQYYGFPRINLTDELTATSGGLFLR